MKIITGATPPLQKQFYRSFIFFIELILITVVASCNSPAATEPVSLTATELPVLETSTAAPSFTPAFTPTDLPTPTFFPTNTQIPTEKPTATSTPIYTTLRGEVLMLANCRYGPGASYLYKYALIEGSNLEIIGRNDLGTWILVQAIGGNNPCWVKASLMKINGDVMNVASTYLPLPQSPYYSGSPTGVSTARDGNEVIISWNEFPLRAGDDSEQYPYLIEAWVCKDGQLIFTPLGSYATRVTIHDERDCATSSHARLYAVEKHGYTKWVEIPWPQPN